MLTNLDIYLVCQFLLLFLLLVSWLSISCPLMALWREQVRLQQKRKQEPELFVQAEAQQQLSAGMLFTVCVCVWYFVRRGLGTPHDSSPWRCARRVQTPH